MTLESNLMFLEKCKFFYMCYLQFFLVNLFRGLINYRSHFKLFLLKRTIELSKLFGALLIVLTDSILVFAKKSNLNFNFCLFIVRFVDL